MKRILLVMACVVRMALPAQFEPAQLICVTPPANQSIHPMDFDGDGDQDVLVTNGLTRAFDDGNEFNYYHTPATISAQTFGVCENQGTIPFEYHPLAEMNAEVYWAFGDVNNDGLSDFLWAEKISANGISLQLNCRMNLGNFLFGPDELVFGLPIVDEEADFAFKIEQIAIGDINNDGDNEILAALNGLPFDLDTYTYAPISNVYAFDYNNGEYSDPNWICATEGTNGFEGAPLIDILVFDVNEDGLNDIVTQWQIGEGNSLDAALAISPGVFSEASSALIPESIAFNWEYGVLNNGATKQFISSTPMFSYIFVGTDVQGHFPGLYAEAPGLALIDTDENGIGEIILPTVSGEILYFDEGNDWPLSDNQLPWNPKFFPEYQLLDMEIPDIVTSMSRMDFDGDGDQDLVFIAEGNVYIAENTGYPSSINSKLNDILKVYPNPAQDFLVIEFSNTPIQDLKVFNAHGQLIHWDPNPSGNQVRLSCAAWQPGLYSVFVNESVVKFVKE